MSNADSEAGAQLRALIAAEQDLLLQVLDVMDGEQEAMLGRDSAAAEQLATVLSNKQQLLATLETATRERLQWLALREVSADSDNVLRFTDGLDSSGTLSREYRGFADTAEACRQRNQALGHLNRRRQQTLLRAADALGLSEAGSSASYSNAGTASTAPDTRLLGSA
ncbi:MAG: flagellar export chaperone FlgN [Halieaceae bacterium]